MSADYWDVSDEQVVEKTGKNLAAWKKILDDFHARAKRSLEVVTFLQEKHAVPRYWARTLTTWHQKQP